MLDQDERIELSRLRLIIKTLTPVMDALEEWRRAEASQDGCDCPACNLIRVYDNRGIASEEK